MATCHPSEKTNNIQSTQHKFMQQNYIYFFFWEGKKKRRKKSCSGCFLKRRYTKPQRQDAAHVHVLIKIK